MDLNDMFSMIFEWGGLAYLFDFSDELFTQKLYLSIGLLTTIVSFFLVLTFYFIINRPSFSRWQHWLIMLLINFTITFLIGFIIPQNTFYGVGIDYFDIMQYITFGLITAFTATTFFVIWTYCFKWWKSAAKGTPKLFLGKF